MKSVIVERNGKSPRELAAEMHMGGMNIKDVSIAIGIPYGTVYGWLRGRKTNGSGRNADRHLCKTCRYRTGSYERSATGVSCNYWDLMSHSRGCKVAECTVYVKGPIMRRRKREGRGASI